MSMSKLSVHSLLAVLCSSVVLTACPGDEPSGETDANGSESSSGSVVTTMPLTTTSPDDTPTTGETTVGVDDTSSSGVPLPTTGEPTGDESTTGDASTGEPTAGASTTGDATTGEPVLGGYGDCGNLPPLEACLPEEMCLTDAASAVCGVVGCEDAGDCPVPLTGDAVVSCVDLAQDGLNRCYLDCAGGETCPDGMTCMFGYACLWQALPVGGGACPDEVLGSAVPQVIMGDNTGQFDDDVSTCSAGGGEDSMYQFTAAVDGTYVFDTFGTMFDTVLTVLDGCGGPELDCNDDTGGLTSQVAIALVAGQSVVVVVDSFDGEVGAFILNIAQM